MTVIFNRAGGSSAPKIVVLTAILSIAMQRSSALALQTNGDAPQRYSRFYQPTSPNDLDKDFIGKDYKWSGIGRVLNQFGEYTSWATMISDHYYLTASHNRPAEGATVYFYQGNDNGPSSVSWSTTVLNPLVFQTGSNVQVGPDLAIGKLSTAPPDWVERYPLMKRQEGTNYTALASPEVFIVGANPPNTSFQMQVGRNVINELRQPKNILWSYDTDSTGLGADEAQTVWGDSSGPTFALVGSRLALVGIHSRSGQDQSISANLNELIAHVAEPVSKITDLPGDINGDYRVQGGDLSIMLSNFNHVNARYRDGDINGDYVVNDGDLSLLLTNYNAILQSPVDFDTDFDVDNSDFSMISSHWGDTVTPGTEGDVSGPTIGESDGVVGRADIEYLSRYWRPFVSLPSGAPTFQFPGDWNKNGVVDDADLSCAIDVTCDADGDGDFNDNNAEISIANMYMDEFWLDLDNDNRVGLTDLDVLLSRYGDDVSQIGQFSALRSGDFNQDGVVNRNDIDVMKYWWGFYPAGSGGSPIPEPATLSLLGLALIGCLAGATDFRPRVRRQ